MLFSSCLAETRTVIQAIRSFPFINSRTAFSDVGYARTCVGESLNELSLSPFLPPLPRVPPALPRSFYELLLDLYKKPTVDGRARSVWDAALERRDAKTSMAQVLEKSSPPGDTYFCRSHRRSGDFDIGE